MTADDRRQKDDREIVRAISNHLRMVRALFRAQNIPVADHDDLCQEVTLITWDAAKQGFFAWHNRRVLRSYMRTIAERVGIAEHHARKRRNRMVNAAQESLFTEPPDIDAVVAAAELLRLMQASTKPERWEVIVLYAQGRSVPFIAKRLAMPTGTGYTLLRTGRIDLAKALRVEAQIQAGRRRAKPRK